MDPVTQGAIGAAFAQTRARKEHIIAATWLGCLAGMAPDLDVLIQSPNDPLLFLEFHRHFTHALIFIPFGALIVGLVLFAILRKWLTRSAVSFKQAYLYCLLGYATHALLDACTSYGTQLFWPFSDTRVAWNNVSVVDPLFTLPLLTLVILGARKRMPQFAFWGIAWAIGYLLLGVVQMERATQAARELAQSRGHTPQRLTVKPSFANLVLWKSIYATPEGYHVDAIRTTGSVSYCPGPAVARYDPAIHLPHLDPNSQQAKDIERFRWFSDDYLGVYQANHQIIDIRYSMVPNQIDPMWGIRIDTSKNPSEHVQWWAERSLNEEKRQLFDNMLFGDLCQPLRSL